MRGMAAQDSQQNPDGQEVAGVLALLLAGAAGVATAGAIASLLSIPLGAVLPVLRMMDKDRRRNSPRHNVSPPVVSAKKSPTQIVSDANNHYRAAFLINSSRRVAEAADPEAQLKREQQFWNAHIAASNRRLLMSKMTEDEAQRHGPLLGWNAKIDARTTEECRAANGRNFYAYSPPVIGYPGAVHLYCRCVPGPPHVGGKMVDDSTTVQVSREASGFEKREGNGS